MKSAGTPLFILAAVAGNLPPGSDAFTVSPQASSTAKLCDKHRAMGVSTLSPDLLTGPLIPPEQVEIFGYTNEEETVSPDLYSQEQKGVNLLEGGEPAFSYESFATNFPIANNMMIASGKAAVADLFAQAAIAQTGIDALDWQRTFLFCLFGAFYQGGFQYMYQVNLFSKVFDNVEQFTSQPWAEKLKDGAGLKSLGAQVILDLIIMSSIYLPTYYTFKASIFSGTMDPSMWLHDGIASYGSHFGRDEAQLLSVWLPADLFLFSCPLVMRLPLRQVVSLFYTAYLSSATFGN